MAQVAPPFASVPPHGYGGTERVVHALATELDRRGHRVTTFASGDSDVPGELVTTVPSALWSRPETRDTADALPYVLATIRMVLDRAAGFDIIHSHLEWSNLDLARLATVPVVATFHGRLDLPWAADAFRDAPDGLVAISQAQASTHPDVPWAAVVHNGLDLSASPIGRPLDGTLCFVGRVAPEKGIVEAIEVAKASGHHLRIAARIATTGDARAYHDAVFLPALRSAGSAVTFLGELSQEDRDRLLAESRATLMPGAWPEPFGLVAIESMACGTPVIGRRVGALPEIIRHGVDGFLGDDVMAMSTFVGQLDTLDRAAIRTSVGQRFSAERMTDGYESLYRSMAGDEAPRGGS